MEGYGEFHDSKTNMLYIGFFEKNLYHGFGVLRNFNDNYIYVGEWRQNQREGVARYYKNNIEAFGKFEKNTNIMTYEKSDELIRSIKEEMMYLLPYFTTKSLKEIKEFAHQKRIMAN